MTRDVDGDDFLETEIPFEVRYDKGRYEASACCIDVDGAVDIVFY